MEKVRKSTKAPQQVKTRPAKLRAEKAPRKPSGHRDPQTVAGRITICRGEAKLNKATAAKRAGITAQSWGLLESGVSRQPAADTLLNMRDKLGFNPDYIIRGKGMPLLPNFEQLAQEQALILIFRELRPEIQREAVRSIQALRRAQGGPSLQDPFLRDRPDAPDDDD